MNRRRRGRGALSAFLVVISLCVFAVGVLALRYVLTESAASGRNASALASLNPKKFAEYDWEELAEVATLISDAPSDEEGVELASNWGIEVGDTRALPLEDGHQATLTVVGIRCDERSDGSGAAGITLMASPISLEPMQNSVSNVGGWEASALREWLSTEGLALLPEGLSEGVVSVRKRTNNVGATSDVDSVTSTDDVLWPFSVSEVCGTVDLFAAEYGDEVRSRTGYIDYTAYDVVLNAEGAQYPYFAERGVTCHGDPQGTLELAYSGTPCGWWYRSAYPLSFGKGDDYFFYQVMESGYPVTLGSPDQAAGVVVGLCL